MQFPNDQHPVSFEKSEKEGLDTMLKGIKKSSKSQEKA
jgi:hypothetical protein